MTLKTQTPQELFSIQDFVSRLNNLPSGSFGDVRGMHQFICAHPVDPETLAPYLTWDKQHYTRNLIGKTEAYALMAICWDTGQGSSIHNHRDQNCWMAVPIGRLLVENYLVLFQDINEGRCALETADTLEMNPSRPGVVDPLNPVHRVYNPSDFNQRAVSLHIYSQPFDTCVVYSPERGTCGIVDLQYTTEYGNRVRDERG
jgi:cysteine dioxygenase